MNTEGVTTVLVTPAASTLDTCPSILAPPKKYVALEVARMIGHGKKFSLPSAATERIYLNWLLDTLAGVQIHLLNQVPSTSFTANVRGGERLNIERGPRNTIVFLKASPPWSSNPLVKYTRCSAGLSTG